MGRFSTENLQSFSENLLAIYSDANPQTFPVTMLETITKLVPCHLATYDKILLKERKILHVGWPSSPPAENLAVFEAYVHEHPYVTPLLNRKKSPAGVYGTHYKKSMHNIISIIRQFPSGQVLKFSDVLTKGEYHKLGLYNEFYRVYGIEHQMLLVLFKTEEFVAGVTLNRELCDFSEGERNLLKLLFPHIVRAHNIAALLSGARSRNMNFDLVDGNQHLAVLTGREREVLQWVAKGKSNADVAAILGIKPDTIKKHLLNVYNKLGVENRVAALSVAGLNLSRPCAGPSAEP